MGISRSSHAAGRYGGFVAAAGATLQYAAILFAEQLGYMPEYLLYSGIRGAASPLVSLNSFGVFGLTFFLAAILSALFGMRLMTTEDALSDSLRNFDRLATLYKQIFDNISTGIVTIAGEKNGEIDYIAGESLLKDALKALKAAKENNWSLKSAQSAWKDMASVKSAEEVPTPSRAN